MVTGRSNASPVRPSNSVAWVLVGVSFRRSVSGSHDRTVRVWELPPLAEPATRTAAGLRYTNAKVLLVGAAYGPVLGAASLGAYLLLGIAGLPLYAGHADGWAVFSGATGGEHPANREVGS